MVKIIKIEQTTNTRRTPSQSHMLMSFVRSWEAQKICHRGLINKTKRRK